MGRNGRAALRAVTDLLRLDRMMRTTLAATRIGMSTLWNSHGSKSPTKITCFSKTNSPSSAPQIMSSDRFCQPAFGPPGEERYLVVRVVQAAGARDWPK